MSFPSKLDEKLSGLLVSKHKTYVLVKNAYLKITPNYFDIVYSYSIHLELQRVSQDLHRDPVKERPLQEKVETERDYPLLKVKFHTTHPVYVSIHEPDYRNSCMPKNYYKQCKITLQQ